MSNFDFVASEWAEIADEAKRAEYYTNGDPRSSLFYARRTVELVVSWMYRADTALNAPYKDDLAARIHEPSFKVAVGAPIFTKMNIIRMRGNDAVHKATPLGPTDSLPIVRELFYVLVWFATHYATDAAHRPAAGIPFDAASLPKPQPGLIAQTQLQLKVALAENQKKDEQLVQALKDNEELAAQVVQLQADVAAAKAANAAVPDPHDYHEAETRELYIDTDLRRAGWDPNGERVREFRVESFDGEGKTGFVDYVLWGDDALPLAVVEAKRTTRDARAGQQQAKLYADALERSTGQRPVIFYTNGYETFLWDDLAYPPRQVQGFYTKAELALLVQRHTAKHPLTSISIDSGIVERRYQHHAIRAVTEAFGKRERRALVVMATGSGKTRTVIALVDLLTRANWVKRVLFLADRVALVNQAVNAFKQHLPDLPPVNLVDERDKDARVYVSTYPTMMGLIDQGVDAQGDDPRFGPGYFDLIVVDEAHRSVYQKYGEIFDYFDALVVGLTATPRDEVDHNTYRLFQLEDGIPTYSYELQQAIDDGYLVAPVARSITSKFMARGIRYDELRDDEKEQWDLLEWQDGAPPAVVDADAVNKWLFNTDTVDGVLKILMTEGRRVAGGDRLGKTIVFAKNIKHAEFIVERFDANYPEYAGQFARVITSSVEHAQNLLDAFGVPEKAPHIAVSVDMLDTGIDVPEVVNLVFFKQVFSKTKYWQMIGRGTRLRSDLYGPGEPKTDFVVFDVGGNIEFFNQQLPELTSGTVASLSERLFLRRLRLVEALGASSGPGAMTDADRELRRSVADGLHSVVLGMSDHNFLVRAHRQAVERFTSGDAWADPALEDLAAAAELAGLPSAAYLLDTDERAKRFDLLVLTAQLAVLSAGNGAGAGLDNARERIRAVAEALGAKRTIPAIAAYLELIDAVASVDWWADVTAPMLELVRVRLRDLVRLIDVAQQAVVYVDFDDEVGGNAVGDGASIIVASPGVNAARFREKLYAFLTAHGDHVALHKLRTGRQLTATDVDELERMLEDSGEFPRDQLDREASDAHGLGRLIRSVTGMERSAAEEALSRFVSGTNLASSQIAFVDLVIDQLSASGSVSVELLYEAPFSDLAPEGPEAIFTDAQVTSLIDALKHIDATAVPA